MENANRKRGGITAQRKEYYEYIKQHGLLNNVKERFGQPVTRCSTESLRDFVAEHQTPPAQPKKTRGPKVTIEQVTVDAKVGRVLTSAVVKKALRVAGKAMSRRKR